MGHLRSRVFRQALQRAAHIASDPDQLSSLLGSVSDKLSDMDQNKKRVRDFFAKVRTMMRMMHAYITGDYRKIPWKTLLLITGSLIYFIMPLDAIPDFIPFAGLTDDIAIVLLVFNSINDDIREFLEYERTTGRGGSKGQPY